MRWRDLTRLPGALSIVAAMAAWGCSGDASDAMSTLPSTLVVETIEVHEQPGHAVRESYAGRVASPRSSDLGFDRPGRVVELLVDEGDHVEKDQRLGSLETRDLRAEIRELRAREAASAARLELAKLTTKRSESLVGSDSISKQAYDEARFNQAALEADLEAARAGIARARVALELSELHAPFAGTIVLRNVDEGTVVTPGQPVFRVIEDGAMELRVGIPVATADGLTPGGRYPVEIEGNGFLARLVRKIPMVDPRTRTMTAVFEIEPADDGKRKRPRDGALGRLQIDTPRAERGFWLPISALSEGRRGLWSAYAVEPDPEAPDRFRVEQRDLQVIHVETDRVFVDGTLQDGDRIVASGIHRIVPGQPVRLATPRAAVSPDTDPRAGHGHES